MGIFDDTLLKRIPKYNVFKSSPTVLRSFGLGTLDCVYWRNMVPGERLRMKLSQLTRFSPLVAPVMGNYDMDFMAFEVPKRVMDHNFGTNMYKFFNPATPDLERGNLPFARLLDFYKFGDITGTLADQIGLPSLVAFRKVVLEFAQSAFWESNGVSCPLVDTTTFPPYEFFNMNPAGSEVYQGEIASIPLFHGVPIYEDGSFAVKHIFKYLVDKFNIQLDFGDSRLFSYSALLVECGINSYEAMEGYVDYLLSTFIKHVVDAGIHDNYNPEINMIPFFAYWQIIADWYINSNVDGDTDEFINHLDWAEIDDKISFGASFLKPFHRYWKNDRFTSAFPNAMYSNSQVAIPVGGTIKDLRQAFVIDGFKQTNLYSGKRYIDSIFANFGIKSSNALLDRSSCIGIINNTIAVDAVSQTNQADINSALESPIGTLTGQGTSVNRSEYLFDFTAEEHTTIMVLCCVRPKAVYSQGINRELLKDNFYDFLVPNFDKIGEQPVYNGELYYDYNSSEALGIFGFNRRYYEYMQDMSSVHGEFRTSLDYWTNSRQFASAPTLTSAFLRVDAEADNLNRVFAVPSVDPIRQMIRFDIELLSPLQKIVTYDL